MNHRRIAHSHGVAFWKDGVAADEATADRAVVYLGPPGMPYPEFEFELPKEAYKMEEFERALGKAYDKGFLDAKAEIRAVLGVKEPR